MASTPTFDELASFIQERFDELRSPYMQWTNLARLIIQGRPYNAQSFAEVQSYINNKRTELRKAVLLASEHLTEAELECLRSQAHMSKTAWRSLQRNAPITIKNGFKLISY